MQVKCIKNNFKVESREEEGGRSAWSLCSGLPLRLARARQPRTTLLFLLPSPYLPGAHERASHALPSYFFSLLPTFQARTSAPATHCPLFPSPFSLPSRLARARQPRTALSSLLPSPYLAGSPERASHELFPTFFSLLPSLEAHCIVAKHYPLIPYPFSLLWKPTA